LRRNACAVIGVTNRTPSYRGGSITCYWEGLEARRLFAFGSLDTTFGDGGHVAALPLTEYVFPVRTLVQSDGRIVVAGRYSTDWALRRYLPDGSADTRFVHGGLLKLGEMLGLAPGNQVIGFLAETADGGLYVGGDARLDGEPTRGPNDPATMLIAKLKFDGTLDTTFLPSGASNVGHAGLFRVGGGSPGSSQQETVKQVRGGKLLVSTGGQPSEILLTRYKPNGQLDRSWGGTGRVSINIPIPIETIEPSGKLPMSFRFATGLVSHAEAPDDSIVGIGYYVYARGSGASEDSAPYTPAYLPYLVRLSSTGELLATKVYPLDINKAQTTRYSGLSLIPWGTRIGADGKIYVFSKQLLVRFNADLSLDTNWSDDGIASTTTVQDGTTFTATLADLIVQADGKAVGVVRDIFNSVEVTSPLLVRYNLDSSIDATAQLTPTPAWTDPIELTKTLNGLALSADGTILVAGENVPLSRVFRDEGPAGRLEAGSVTNANAGSIFKFGITWRDEDGVDPDSLDNGDLEILTPTGGRLIARVISRTQQANGAVLVRYRTGPPNGIAWTAADNGRYIVRLLSNRVRDALGAFAPGRTLGAFDVRVS
jgi:uncharacterized delta-60 repeat protein